MLGEGPSSDDQTREGKQEGESDKAAPPAVTWADVALSIGAELMFTARDEILQSLGYTTSAVRSSFVQSRHLKHRLGHRSKQIPRQGTSTLNPKLCLTDGSLWPRTKSPPVRFVPNLLANSLLIHRRACFGTPPYLPICLSFRFKR